MLAVSTVWPVFLIIIGVYLMLKRGRKEEGKERGEVKR